MYLQTKQTLEHSLFALLNVHTCGVIIPHEQASMTAYIHTKTLPQVKRG